MSSKIEWVDMKIHMVGVNCNEVIEFENVRMDRLELNDTGLYIEDLHDNHYIIPMDSLLYIEYKIVNDN